MVKANWLLYINLNNSTLGILYTNESLRNLLADLKLDYPDIYYLITRRVNQDLLENLFSYLKGMNGANTHLTPLDFKHWYTFSFIELKFNFYTNSSLYYYFNSLKWYLLGKHAHVAFTESRNTEDTHGERLIDTECLSSSVLKNSEIYIEELTDVNSIDSVGKAHQEQMDLLKCFEEQVSINYI